MAGSAISTFRFIGVILAGTRFLSGWMANSQGSFWSREGRQSPAMRVSGIWRSSLFFAGTEGVELELPSLMKCGSAFRGSGKFAPCRPIVRDATFGSAPSRYSPVRRSIPFAWKKAVNAGTCFPSSLPRSETAHPGQKTSRSLLKTVSIAEPTPMAWALLRLTNRTYHAPRSLLRRI